MSRRMFDFCIMSGVSRAKYVCPRDDNKGFIDKTYGFYGRERGMLLKNQGIEEIGFPG